MDCAVEESLESFTPLCEVATCRNHSPVRHGRTTVRSKGTEVQEEQIDHPLVSAVPGGWGHNGRA